MWVTLEREPSNRHDSNAIRVHIQGATVGYVPRHETANLQGLLQAAERQGVVVMAWGRVWYSGDGDDPRGSVSYDMGDVAQVWPVTVRPDDSTSAIWPVGRKLKVSVDDEFKGVVQNWLARAYTSGKCVAYLKLDRPDDAKKLSVSFEGTALGALSPAASAKMGEIVTIATAVGRSVWVLGEVTGNAVVAEVRILVKPPEELTNQEISALTAPLTAANWAPPSPPN